MLPLIFLDSIEKKDIFRQTAAKHCRREIGTDWQYQGLEN